MGAVTGLFGSGPTAQQANLLNPLGSDQAKTSYNQGQNALNQQQQFLNALQGQNGIGNQTSVFNQLQGVANGTGPNPAQAMLDQQTGQNVAQQGALMAGQRGAGANPALIARQAAQQGASTQQQAVGQGATMQANQSLGALSQLGGIAGQQVGQQAGAVSGLNQAAQGQEGQVLNQINAQNNAALGNAQTANSLNASKYGAQTGLAGSLINSATPGHAAGGMITPQGPRSAIGRAMLSQGGKVPAIVSPGERILSPTEAKQVASGQKKATQVGYNVGGKARTPGDSTKNDTVKKDLTPGSVVVKRTKNMGDDVTEKATAFVRAVMAKGGHR